MLTANEILKRVENEDIYIEGFTEDRLNPNSYNLTLNEKLLVYDDGDNRFYRNPFEPWKPALELDSKKKNPVIELIIPKEGYVLMPGTLYLGSTNEHTETDNLVPCISGRSSIARLGLCVHVTAGFGDIGFKGKWTLEMTVVHPLRIYPNMEICQIYYEEILGDVDRTYKGKYQNQPGVVESRMYQDFK
jgi:dCTP deaminase